MKIFLTGATGFIGTHLADALIGKGYEVCCLVKSPGQAKNLKQKGCHTITGDLTDIHLGRKISPELTNTDLVIHLAALFAEWGPSKGDYQEVNVEGTTRLLQASWENRVEHFILISTAHVLGNPPNHTPAAETDTPHPDSGYAHSKLAAEKKAVAYFNKGLPVTILRPTFVYGPGDSRGAFFRFFQRIKNGRVIIVGSGRNFFQPLFVEDLVAAILAAAKKPGRGEIYLIAGRQQIRLQQLLKLLAKSLKVRNPKIIRLPYLLSLAVSYPASTLFTLGRMLHLPILRDEPFLEPRKVKFSTGSFTYKITRAETDLGYRPRHNLKIGLRETAESLEKSFPLL